MSGSRAGAPLEFSWRQYLAMTPSTAIEANDGGISFYSSLELFRLAYDLFQPVLTGLPPVG